LRSPTNTVSFNMPDYEVHTFEQDSREEKAFYDTAKKYGIEIHENEILNGFGDMSWIVEASDGDTLLDWYFDTGNRWGAKDYVAKSQSDKYPKEM